MIWHVDAQTFMIGLVCVCVCVWHCVWFERQEPAVTVPGSTIISSDTHEPIATENPDSFHKGSRIPTKNSPLRRQTATDIGRDKILL